MKIVLFVLGWKFGDGHLCDERPLPLVQEPYGFADGAGTLDELAQRALWDYGVGQCSAASASAAVTQANASGGDGQPPSR